MSKRKSSTLLEKKPKHLKSNYTQKNNDLEKEYFRKIFEQITEESFQHLPGVSLVLDHENGVLEKLIKKLPHEKLLTVNCDVQQYNHLSKTYEKVGVYFNLLGTFLEEYKSFLPLSTIWLDYEITYGGNKQKKMFPKKDLLYLFNEKLLLDGAHVMLTVSLRHKNNQNIKSIIYSDLRKVCKRNNYRFYKKGAKRYRENSMLCIWFQVKKNMNFIIKKNE